MNCNYKVKITDIQNKYQFKILCKGGANSTNVNDIYNLLPTTTNENTNITISNTADIKAKSIAIKGNTTQQTYQGYNLCNKDGEIRQGGTVSNVDTTRISISMAIQLKANTKYTFVTDLNLTNFAYAICLGTVKAPWAVAQQLYDSGWITSPNYHTVTTTQACYMNIVVRRSNNSALTPSAVNDFWFMVYEGNYDSSKAYEKYVGGYASPNPSYPQDIINVTGLNTINVSNSDNSISKDFTINLGSIELCKIGTYQDYIYQNNGKWYLYKAINKKELSIASMNETDNWPGWSSTGIRLDYPSENISLASKTYEISNIFGLNSQVNINTLVSNDKIFFSASSIGYTQTQLQEQFPNLVFVLYYGLKTPTITEITDTTLIKQLNNISNNIRTFEGGTNISSTSAGANPIINITTFNKLS